MNTINDHPVPIPIHVVASLTEEQERLFLKLAERIWAIINEAPDSDQTPDGQPPPLPA